jgi:hypothetical protein
MNGLSAATIALIVLIGGWIATPLTSLLKREKWPSQIKQLICMVVSAAVAVVAVEIDQPKLLTGQNVADLAALIFGWATLTYGWVFKGTPVDNKLTAIGSKPKETTP